MQVRILAWLLVPLVLLNQSARPCHAPAYSASSAEQPHLHLSLLGDCHPHEFQDLADTPHDNETCEAEHGPPLPSATPRPDHDCDALFISATDALFAPTVEFQPTAASYAHEAFELARLTFGARPAVIAGVFSRDGPTVLPVASPLFLLHLALLI